MSDTSQGPGWWLAADGRWYPPELAPATPDGPTPGAWPGAIPAWDPYRTPAASVPAGLATALRVTFYVVAGLTVVRALLSVVGWIAFSRFEDGYGRGRYDTWRNVALVEGGWGLVVGIANITLLVLVIVWSWKAHRAVTDLGAQQSWRIGWTIGGWFTCCAAIVIPKLVLNGIERGALSPRRDGRVRARWDVLGTEPIGWLWWLALVASFFRVEVTSGSDSGAYATAVADSGSITTAYAFAVLTAVLAVVAALAGASYFRRMSARLSPEGLAAHPND
jgi:hypothetical protein